MKKRWHLFTLMAIFALGVTLISWPRSAQADLGTLTASVNSTTVGQTATITGSMSNLSGASVTLVSSSGNWVTGTVSTGETVSGVGTPLLSFTSSGSTVSSTLVGTYTCTVAGTVTFTLSQNPAPSAGASFLTTTLTCTAPAATVITVTPPAAAINTAATVSGSCTTAGELINSAGPGQFVAFPPPTNLAVTAATTATCNVAGIYNVTFICTGDGIVTFTQNNASGTLYCGNTSNILSPFCPAAGYPYGSAYPFPGAGTYPYATGSFPYGNTGYPYAAQSLPGAYPFGGTFSFCNYVATPVAAATTLTMTASATHIACGSSVFVTVRVNSGYGNLYVPDGTQVTLTTTGGTLSSAATTTQAGQVMATFQAPPTSGAVTISAASGNATNSVTINVDCPVVVVPAPAAPVQVVAPQYITPPNTGDAGLSD
jgi:hypothetical protein